MSIQKTHHSAKICMRLQVSILIILVKHFTFPLQVVSIKTHHKAFSLILDHTNEITTINLIYQ